MKLFLSVCVLATLMPFVSEVLVPSRDVPADFPGWPSHWEGALLKRVPLTAREERFAAEFPGHLANFTDGRRLFILRFTDRATRKLHSSAGCFSGAGYSVRPEPLFVDTAGNRWGSFLATKKDETVRVRERISDAGGSWTDVSSWYWSAAYGRSRGPWWAVTIVDSPGAG